MTDILWTIYLGVLGAFAIGYFIKGGYKSNSAKLDFVISIFTWIGLFGYVTSNDIQNPLVWKTNGEIPKAAQPIVFG